MNKREKIETSTDFSSADVFCFFKITHCQQTLLELLLYFRSAIFQMLKGDIF
ncbi:hypothetical protein [Lysinibacillus pakistanensis]|uniref:Uncharacterized protein n=1 Tax=Lysinibacillus pakistanensis TaxID=759811 RepID=A0AAX3WSF6_9BACI|nr:hypothetical protein [Lysinibacillus pakistanensis]MDM5230176.1 hypothetical protein [Lysinibacillus pakistanensis]WHY45770.1 hypothetical protein QNH22_21220 [Lysinibacillus pakistanensis]WHY50780.1 hypothetical protein QNH24_21185 [Lysinibacillus pakistanensis]